MSQIPHQLVQLSFPVGRCGEHQIAALLREDLGEPLVGVHDSLQERDIRRADDQPPRDHAGSDALLWTNTLGHDRAIFSEVYFWLNGYNG